MGRISARSVLCGALACVLLSGCATGRSGVPIDYDNPLEEKLVALLDDSEGALLRDLTDFSWDEVHRFRGQTREKIEEVLGTPAIRDSSFHPEVNLLVFEERGEVVKVVGINGILTAERPTWPRDVRVQPWRGLLRLTLP